MINVTVIFILVFYEFNFSDKGNQINAILNSQKLHIFVSSHFVENIEGEPIQELRSEIRKFNSSGL